MRSIVLIVLAVLAVATTPARAQSTWLESKMIEQMCAGKMAPEDNTDRLAKRLNLTDAQKSALKDLTEASSAGAASMKSALCGEKPDLSTAPSRLSFSEKMMEARLASLKAIEPKLQAFYDALDAKQKTAFETGGRVGGFFDWWGKR
jgi:Spy/CpxP family protein refolding chaperone